jgi:hypothetical protein
VVEARRETEEEALRRVLADYIDVNDIERTGITTLRFTVQYNGAVELEFDSYELEGFEWSEDMDPDNVDAQTLLDSFKEEILEAIQQELYLADLDIVDIDAE